jgi:N-acetyl-alpha-D-glucosaminyl L-malate synthase BshA
MKIGISCYPTIGGSGVVASELGMALAKRGHQVHFITYAIPNRLDLRCENLFYHEVSVPEYPLLEYAPYSLALASKMADCASEYGLDIIHAHYAIPHAASAILARGIIDNGLKVVTTLHGTDVTLVGRNASFMPITRYAIEQSDYVTVVSNFLRQDVRDTFTCDKDIKVIYNFIDPDEYRNIKSSELRKTLAPNGEKLLIHVSNFRPVKKVMDVLNIFVNVKKQLPARLILVGHGPDFPKLEHKATEYGVSEDVLAMGNRDSVIDLLTAADILLLPSRTESFGLAALEAMAAGTVPLTSNAGGLPEVVEHGVNGWTADVGDVQTLTNHAINTLQDSNLLETMSNNARKTVFEKFNIDKSLAAYEQLYEQAISTK